MLSPRGNAGIGNQDALGTAFFKTEGEIANQFTAGTYAAAAEDAAVVFQNDIWMGSIHRIGLPVWLKRPMGHSFVVGSILKFAITTADLAVRAKMVAFAEDQGKNKFAGIQYLFGVWF